MYRTINFTPLFNKNTFYKEINYNGGVDKTFHLRILETVAFPKTTIVKIGEVDGILELIFPKYSKTMHLFTFSSFIQEGEGEEKNIPSKNQILNDLLNFPKIPYLLGGTTPFVIDMMSFLTHDVFTNRHRKIFGIDCSGLLYFVTNGYLPRNTSQMWEIGKQVKDIEPLDIILFPGHVIIYLTDGKVIESRQFDGVTISKWEERISQIPKEYKIIRWYPQAFEEKFSQDAQNQILIQK
jgi:hypothetical protein